VRVDDLGLGKSAIERMITELRFVLSTLAAEDGALVPSSAADKVSSSLSWQLSRSMRGFDDSRTCLSGYQATQRKRYTQAVPPHHAADKFRWRSRAESYTC
jgi:hypothetical protein